MGSGTGNSEVIPPTIQFHLIAWLVRQPVKSSAKMNFDGNAVYQAQKKSVSTPSTLMAGDSMLY